MNILKLKNLNVFLKIYPQYGNPGTPKSEIHSVPLFQVSVHIYNQHNTALISIHGTLKDRVFHNPQYLLLSMIGIRPIGRFLLMTRWVPLVYSISTVIGAE